MTDRQLPLAAPSPGAAALRPFAAVRAEIEDDREHQYPTRGTLFVRSRASDRAGRALDGDFTPWVPFAPPARPDQNGLDGPDFFLMERNMLRGFTQRAEDLASQERERARA